MKLYFYIILMNQKHKSRILDDVVALYLLSGIQYVKKLHSQKIDGASKL